VLLQVHATSLFSSEYSNPSHNAVLTVHSQIYLKYLGKNICQELTNLKYMPLSAGGYSTATAAGSISCTSSVYVLNFQKCRCLKQLVVVMVGGHKHPYLQKPILSTKLFHNFVMLNIPRPNA
jgi:hypothetical protein